MKLPLSGILWLSILTCATALAAASGSLRSFDIESDYVSARKIEIWLPASYDSSANYPVLYMNDGQNLFDISSTWNGQEWRVDETLDSLVELDLIEPPIVVAVPNAGEHRRAEYFPQKVVAAIPEPRRSDMLAIMQDTSYADNYLRFLVEELKPAIDNSFATNPSREHTFIAGASQGATNALYVFCEHPEIFGGAACLSTHWIGISEQNHEIPGALQDYLASCLPPPEYHRLYFDYGGQSLDKMYGPHQQRVDSILSDLGYTSNNWITRFDSNWTHDEASWAVRFPDAVLFLLNP